MSVQTRQRARQEESAEPPSEPRRPRPKRPKNVSEHPLNVSSVPDTSSQPTMRLLFLLRAVNVSGSNMCNMKRLAQLSSADLGWQDVSTYLQSGNLIASVPASLSIPKAGEQLQDLLAENIAVHTTVLSRTLEELNTLINNCPYDASDPTKVHVFFLSSLPTAASLSALSQKTKKDDLYMITPSGRELYLSYPNGAGRAALTGGVLEKVLGVKGAGRNWRTVLAVKEMLRD